MTLSKVTEAGHGPEFLKSEANGGRSRENIVIDASQTLKAGQVLGKKLIASTAAVGAAGVPAPAAATITAAPTASGLAKGGEHAFACIIGGGTTVSKWRHIDPDGVLVGVATGNTAYAGGGISGLTITDTGTDPVVGETFTVTVTHTAGNLRYVMHDPEATTGAQTAAAILYDAITTGVGETAPAVGIVRDAEVFRDRLTWDDQDTTEKAAAIATLAAAGVIAR